MESKRQQKFSKLVQKELADIFQRDSKSLFGGAFITVTEVKVSPDLGLAKVYLSFMLIDDKKEMLKKVKENKSKIRNLLGSKIRKQVRVIPDLNFYLDESLEHASKMEDLFEKIKTPPRKENDEESDQENE